VLGACERIRNTPIPFAVTATTRLFLLGFTLLVPLGLHQEFGWLAVPVSMSAYLGVAVMDVLAAELENPFGIDCNDLPTRAIAETIRRQVHEILEVERHGRPDVEPATAGVYTKIH
jgi:putative membrane protein